MPNPVEQRFGFLIADIDRQFGITFDRHARGKLELSRAQCRVALYLCSFGPMTQAQLAEVLEVTPMTIARMVDRMQQAGWVVRVPVPNDRRAFHVQATEKSRLAVDQAMRLGDDVTRAATAGLSAAEFDTLIGLLQRVRANLGAQACATREVNES